MTTAEARFLLSALDPRDFPSVPLPEVAFAGRSNVGKSSLINGLLGANLAWTSSTPGKTRAVNFFQVGDGMRWVDLPGYGYAKVSKGIVAGWRDLIETYLLGGAFLRLVIVLVDPRHGPTRSDSQLIDWLKRHDKPIAVVLTKTDKVNRKAAEEARRRCRELHAIPEERVFFYSTRRARHTALWNFIRAQAVLE